VRKFNPFCPKCGTFRNLQNTLLVDKKDASGAEYQSLYYLCKKCQLIRNQELRMKKAGIEELRAMRDKHSKMAELYRKEILSRGEENARD
jgi:phage terminase large subunit GpA-like protein